MAYIEQIAGLLEALFPAFILDAFLYDDVLHTERR